MNANTEIQQDPRYTQRLEAFERAMEIIQQKNLYWFKNRVNMSTGDYPDTIYNYFRYFYDHENNIDLYVMDTLLPEMRQECIVAFHDTFRPR